MKPSAKLMWVGLLLIGCWLLGRLLLYGNEFILPWKYPASINPSNYWWNVERSSNGGPWVTIVSNAPGDVYVTNYGGACLFRLVGRTNQ